MTHVTNVLLTSSGATTRLWLRPILALLGVILAAQAVWTLIPEYHRPDRYLIPGSRTNVSLTHTDRERAYKVAAIEAFRGDLWAEAAFADVGRNWNESSLAADGGKSSERIRMAIMRALRFAPHRGDIWLLFAAMVERYQWPGYQPDALLKMSYYTAPNETGLFPLRLNLALKVSGGVVDDELRDLMRRDIQIILTHSTVLKPALTNAYRSASTEGRVFLERVVMEIDPNAVSAMRAPLN